MTALEDLILKNPLILAVSIFMTISNFKFPAQLS